MGIKINMPSADDIAKIAIDKTIEAMNKIISSFSGEISAEGGDMKAVKKGSKDLRIESNGISKDLFNKVVKKINKEMKLSLPMK